MITRCELDVWRMNEPIFKKKKNLKSVAAFLKVVWVLDFELHHLSISPAATIDFQIIF